MARLLRQARERPADPNLFTGLCHTCRYCGLLDASSAAHERARRLDPKIATSIVHTWFAKGDHQRVADAARSAPFIAAISLIEVGRREEAIALLRELAQKVAPTMRAFLEVSQSLIEGRPQDSVSQLRKVIVRFNDPEALYYAGRHFAHLGELDDAITNLANAVGGGYFCYPAFVADPWLENLRGRPAFEDIVRRAGERHHAALEVFLDEDGDRLLGVRT
jgi:tetratricopeptide (TPR) repeat protein